jgi:hypothetical protein
MGRESVGAFTLGLAAVGVVGAGAKPLVDIQKDHGSGKLPAFRCHFYCK